jgi:hypothetical protein
MNVLILTPKVLKLGTGWKLVVRLSLWESHLVLNE